MEKSPMEFEKIYQYLYDNHINDFEKRGKKLKNKVYILLIVFIIFLLIGANVNKYSENMGGLIALISFVVVFIYATKIFKEYSKYTRIYKDEVITKFIKLLNNQLHFGTLGSKIEQIELNYNKANFDERKYNKFYGDDYIEGYLDDRTYLKLADLNIQRIIRGGRNGDIREDLLQGIFAFFTCNKEIPYRIRICKNNLGMIKNNQENKIEINNAEFEQVFDIFAEDKNFAMRILTPDIMKMFLEFNKTNRFDFEVLLTNNTVYFRFFTGSVFETKIFKNAIDKEILYIEYSILKLIEEFNTKINEVL